MGQNELKKLTEPRLLKIKDHQSQFSIRLIFKYLEVMEQINHENTTFD